MKSYVKFLFNVILGIKITNFQIWIYCNNLDLLSEVCSVPNNLAADDSSGAVVVGSTVVGTYN